MSKPKITLNAPLVLGFVLACSAVTLCGSLTGESSTALLFSTYSASMADPLMYLRLFTHVLGHSGMTHLIGNMAYILLLGPALEEKYGWKQLLSVILITALITGIIHNLLFPRTTADLGWAHSTGQYFQSVSCDRRPDRCRGGV